MTKKLLLASLAAAALAACGSDSNNDTNTCTGTPFAQPAGTVAVNFTVDDSVNKLYGTGDLEWKGQMLYNSTTRVVTVDDTWGGPFAKLYDDGPWACGGHEPAGATAGDNKWGTTVFVAKPATGSTTISYGLQDAYYQTTFGNGWIWPGSNGSFVVSSTTTGEVTAQGLTIPASGTTDFQLVIDKNALDTTNGPWSTATVKVKGSAWAWGEVTLADDGTKGDATAGDGKYTFVLSNYVGAGKPFKHTGLLKSGATAEFIFVLNGVEYKLANGNAATTGVTAGTKASGAGSFTNATISIIANKNSAITVP
ncbi:MAG: choice-of-anchor X domain-containing protein [Anaeromyxobacter sp.]